ncbi:MAG: hypothetical protein ACREBG_00810, partial [Pyrinomonadaceae bacterium]
MPINPVASTTPRPMVSRFFRAESAKISWTICRISGPAFDYMVKAGQNEPPENCYKGEDNAAIFGCW